MMLIANYEQWAAEKKLALEAEDPLIECTECHGEGEIYKECRCCGHETERECEVCDGRGRFHFSESPKPRTGAELISRQVYFREVVTDLKKWCAYTREDFLKLAGRFVNEYREAHR